MLLFEVYELVEERGAFITRKYPRLVGTVEAINATEALQLLPGDYAVLRI